jgi:hypothetical protein
VIDIHVSVECRPARLLFCGRDRPRQGKVRPFPRRLLLLLAGGRDEVRPSQARHKQAGKCGGGVVLKHKDQDSMAAATLPLDANLIAPALERL